MFRAVALDLDGTTLNSEHNVSTRTLNILRNLSAKGVTIILATGRSVASVLDYIHILQLDQEIFPIVVCNGGYGFLYNVKTKELKKCYENPVSVDQAKLLIEMTHDLGLILQYYHGETGEVQAVPRNDDHFALLNRYAELTGKKQIILENYEVAMNRSPSAKVIVLCHDADSLILETRKRFKDTFHIIKGYPDPFFVEFLNPSASKGECLCEVLKNLQISTDEVVAFGDGDNDKEMLENVKLGCAMKNASPLAKQYASITLEYSNNDDGVAIKLEEMLEKNLFPTKV